MSVLGAMIRGLFGGVARTTSVVRSPVARVGFSLILLLGYTIGASLRAGETTSDFQTPAAASADLRRTLLTDYGGPAIFSVFPAPVQETLILLFARPAVWVTSVGIDIGYTVAGWLPLVAVEALGGAAAVVVMAYGAWHFAQVLVEVRG
jgi:hypothetical protein